MPLVPEMASISPLSREEASSSSPTTGMPFSLAAFTTGASMGTPGLIIRMSASSSSFTLSCPRRNRQAVPRRLSSWSPNASSCFISDKMGMAPWRSSSSAAAMPLRAMPTTNTRFFSTFMTIFTSEILKIVSVYQFKGRENREIRHRRPSTMEYMATICCSVMPLSSK